MENSDVTIKLRQYSSDICWFFEKILEEHDITIPDDDREGNEEEGRLYGKTYSDLEDKVTNTLSALVHDAAQAMCLNLDHYNY